MKIVLLGEDEYFPGIARPGDKVVVGGRETPIEVFKEYAMKNGAMLRDLGERPYFLMAYHNLGLFARQEFFGSPLKHFLN